MAGTLALVGSGEYLASMRPLEARLLEGRPAKYVQIATAAVPDGPDRLNYWHELGAAQAAALGVECVIATVATPDEANTVATAEKIRGAGLIYLSGGHPGFLAEVLRGSLLWDTIVDEWHSGASLAGCSAGAMAMTSWIPSLRHPFEGGVEGLGLLPHLRVIPHFDAFYQRMPSIVDRFLHGKDPRVHLIGIDENTALIGGPTEWEVVGHSGAWTLGEERRFVSSAQQLSTPSFEA